MRKIQSKLDYEYFINKTQSSITTCSKLFWKGNILTVNVSNSSLPSTMSHDNNNYLNGFQITDCLAQYIFLAFTLSPIIYLFLNITQLTMIIYLMRFKIFVFFH